MEKACVKVLLVDDDPLVLMNHSDMISDAGYIPTPAGSVEQGWNTGRGRRFDILVCDHDLVDGKGTDLVKRLSEAGIEIPVVYLSAATPKALSEAAKFKQIKKVLSKPVSKESLLGALAELAPAERPGERYPKLVGDEERRMLLDGIGA